MLEKKFRNLSIEERIDFIKNKYNLSDDKTNILKNRNSLTDEMLQQIGENPISIYEQPLRFSDKISVNGKEYYIPMITEEASVVAGLSYGAKICGDIEAKVLESYGIGQAQFIDIGDSQKLIRYMKHNEKEIIEEINKFHSHVKVYKFEIKYWKLDLYGHSVIVDIYFDPKNVMGAAVASKIADEFVKIVYSDYPDKLSYQKGMFSNNSGRLTIANVKIPKEKLERDTFTGDDVKRRIVYLSEFADIDINRSATNNKGIMNGIEAIALALAQDTRAIFTANDNRPSWSKWIADDNYLYGELRMKIPCGTTGGGIGKYPKTKILLEDIIKPKDANQLAEIMASIGIVQNFAALSMNSTIGVTEGHDIFKQRLEQAATCFPKKTNS
jgi:hydroxymethylglutaryl-CoA reductase